MSWPDKRIERLKSLWTKGMTASHIADELGGVSRNAVIGKAHQLGLQSRPSPVKPNEPPPKPRARTRPEPGAAPPSRGERRGPAPPPPRRPRAPDARVPPPGADRNPAPPPAEPAAADA